jgi:hypothetical protein
MTQVDYYGGIKEKHRMDFINLNSTALGLAYAHQPAVHARR